MHQLELAQTLRFFKFENPWNKWYYIKLWIIIFLQKLKI